MMQHLDSAFEKLLRGKPDALDAYLLEVCHNEKIENTEADLHVYMLRIDGNKHPRINDLAEFLSLKIVDYCIPPTEIRKAQDDDKKYNTTSYTLKLRKKAEQLFTDLKNSGEGGELLLSVITQSILHIPQVLCKMPLKTSSEMHYHGADGVYGTYDDATKKFLLYWGESKLYADIDDALSKCFTSIKPLLIEEGASGTQRERDLTLFRDNIDFDNDYLEDAILEYLDPDNTQYLRMEYRGICLVGYTEEAYPKDLSGIEQEVHELIQNKIDVFKSKINSRLKNRTPLDKIKIEVFLIPFSNVEEFRTAFLEVV